MTSEKTKTPRCPDCGGALEIYAGENPHKLATGYCPKDLKRYSLAEPAAATTS